MNDFLMKTLIEFLKWFKDGGINIIIVLFLTWLLTRYLDGIIDRIIRRLVPRGAFVSAEEERMREDTLIDIIQNFLRICLWIISGLAILYYLGVPMTPLLAGAGVFGVAIGLGSQSLVKDVINGLFIIVENQFRLGDIVSIGSHKGAVEGMTLRTTKLRALDGTLHYIPNAEIKVASNHSRDYSMIDMTMDVAYNTNIQDAETLINRIGEELANDLAFSDLILETPQFLRVQNLADFSVQLRILGKVLPKQKFIIEGELRKRLKEAFDKEGIEIPYPTHVIHNK